MSVAPGSSNTNEVTTDYVYIFIELSRAPRGAGHRVPTFLMHVNFSESERDNASEVMLGYFVRY